jgi:putative transposase
VARTLLRSRGERETLARLWRIDCVVDNMHPRRPTRVAGFRYVGFYRYSLRFATYRRARVFVTSAHADPSLLQILRTADEDQFAVLAYCFMPDHLHLVLEGSHETSDLRRFAKVAKQRVSYVFRRVLGVPTLWQEGYYERVLRSDEATDVVVRYVLDNPVRAGLVMRAEDYPFSGAKYWPEA